MPISSQDLLNRAAAIRDAVLPEENTAQRVGSLLVDMIRYKAAAEVIIVDCGNWSTDETYYAGDLNPATQIFETSDVWFKWCRWRCLVTGTKQQPSWDSTDWMFIEGNPDFSVEFEETDYLFDPDNFECDLIIVAWLHNQDITADILDADVVWTRYSEDADGNPRTASDAAWAVKHVGAGKSIKLTRDDCDFNGYTPNKLRFTATVTLRDNSPSGLSATANFEY